VNNLSIAVTAHELNPKLFVVTRQNHSGNSALFAAYNADFTMVHSQIVAQESVAILTAPLLARFLEKLRDQDEVWCHHLVERLQALCAGLTPVVWDIRLNISEAPAAYMALMHDQKFNLGEILRDGTERSLPLNAITLLIERGSQVFLLPDDSFSLIAGDQLLLASPLTAQRNFEFTVRNANELEYVLCGREDSGSWLWQRLAGVIKN
jgi:hypothetical protein